MNSYHVINDPVHGAMQFSHEEFAWIKPFIDHPVFQRLRHIKQLGFADLIFPGAVHTRFNHSLGCCYVANQIANKIGLSPKEKQTVIIAALLHDIGHGPFSHAFEDIFAQHDIRHEEWTPLLFQDFYNNDFLTTYNEKNSKLPLDENDLRAIECLIMHQENNNKLLADIVSSQLDADRLDYLLRDSHFCGVKYGEFDFRWLLHCLSAIETNGEQRLGIYYKGIGVVENYFVSRRLMIRNIYYHLKKYAAEYLLKECLSHLAKELANKDNQCESISESKIGLFLTNTYYYNHSRENNKHAFIENNYPLYKHLCDYDVYSLIRELSFVDSSLPHIKIAKKLQSRHLPKAIPLNNEKFKQAKTSVTSIIETSDIEPWQLAVLNPPHHSYLSKDRIKVLHSQGDTQYIDEVSPIINALLDKEETMYCLMIDNDILSRKEIVSLLKDLKK